jgi:branched-chain amino acid transport system permease protein
MLVLAALVVGAVMGPLLERGLLRWMYGKDEVVLLLITYAAFLILEDAIKLVWGVESKLVAEPYALPGNFKIGDLDFPVYNLILIAVAIVTGIALAWALHRTRRGKLLLAVIHDREVSAAMGINVDRVYLVTFTVGSMLAALGGALTAPAISVSPGIGVEVIILSFAVVVVGGLGSLGGAALGALMVGIVRSFAVRYWPEAELFTIYFVMAMVLIARPKGLFSAPEVRKI